jgi:uncharacterized protein
MEYVVVAIAALVASTLSLYSGFGLGTILLPVFALFVPVELAVAATAIVHGASNVLKVSLLGKMADWQVVVQFGISAVAAALVGAWLLSVVAVLPGGWEWSALGFSGAVTPVNGVLGLLMALFAFVELSPSVSGLRFDKRFLPVGGALSGFFGGLSGHQGALRSAFLMSTRISPEAFVGTNAVIGLAVDAIRIAVYGFVIFGGRLDAVASGTNAGLVLAGTLAAFAGVLIGKRFLQKVTMDGVRRLTGVMLLLIAFLLVSGLI